jgi:hypothetical protein
MKTNSVKQSNSKRILSNLQDTSTIQTPKMEKTSRKTKSVRRSQKQVKLDNLL